MIEELALSPDRQKYSVILPEEKLLDSMDTLEFHYVYTRRPEEVFENQEDTRLLAVAWHSIDFEEPDR